jgi:predicted transposase YbfD/YdcC
LGLQYDPRPITKGVTSKTEAQLSKTSHDTFSRVLQLLDPRKFHDCFVRWVQALHEQTHGQVVPIDGKTLRRSFDSASDLPALHLVSAWAAENRLVLGEIPVDDTSNEIPAVPKLLEILELSGAIVTLDAMGCHTLPRNFMRTC